VLFSALGSLGERIDSRFITAYFFPAFVAVLGSIWILVAAVGGQRAAARIEELDSVEQGIVVGIVLLVTMMLAHMLSALARPIATFYAGRSVTARSGASATPVSATARRPSRPDARIGSTHGIPQRPSRRHWATCWRRSSTTHASCMPWRRFTGGRG
jgi:hypothetical protein